MSNKILKTAVKYLSIDENHQEQRIDNFLINKLKNLPKTRIYRLLRKGEIRVNKKRVDASYRLQLDDVVRLPPMHLEEKVSYKPGQRSLDLLADCILYEDKNIFIINKPAGLPVHGGSGINVGVIESMRALHPKYELELVHRLDLDTSGCLIIAKKRSALRALHALLREGRVRKIYWALTQGEWLPNELKVDVALRKNHLSSGERIVTPDKEGKPSITLFRPLEIYSGSTLVEATLLTGRTHQIRVHARYRHHPIAGDEKYGDRDFNKLLRNQGLKRLFLHAKTLSFTLPGSDLPITVETPLPPDLIACLKKLDV